MKKTLGFMLLLSVALAFGSAGNIDVVHTDGHTLSVLIEPGDFETFTWTENDKSFTRYAFSHSNNMLSRDGQMVEILQLPVVIGKQVPDVTVSVLETEENGHNILNNDLYSVSPVRQFRDRRFVYVTVNPFLDGGRVATKLRVTIDLHEAPGRQVQNKSDRFFINSGDAGGFGEENLSVPILKKTTDFNGEWLDLTISEEGIYALSRQDLVDAGVTSTVTDNELFLYAGPGFGGHLRDEFPDSTDFHLKQVPLLFLDAANDADDKWVFYASPTSHWKRNIGTTEPRNISFVRNAYEDDQHFRLFVGTSSELTLRMVQDVPQFTGSEDIQNYTFQRLHYEQELINPGKGGELWFGRRLSSSNTFTFYLNNLYDSEDIQGGLRYQYGMTTPNKHEFRTYVGNTPMDSVYATLTKSASDYDYEGSITRTRGLKLPNSLMTEELDVRVGYQGSNSTSEGFLDYLDVIYPSTTEAIDGQLELYFEKKDQNRKVSVTALTAGVSYVFDVTDPFAVSYFPVSGTSADIKVSSSDINTSMMVLNETHFRSPDNVSILPSFDPLVSDDHRDQVDLIIISPDAFLDEAERLASFKETRSVEPLTTLVKSYSEIIDQYNAGNRDPYAIWHFLADMYKQSPAPKPLYVLLLGDGHYDYQNKLFSTPVRIPYLYEPGTLWPCDDVYVMVSSSQDLSNDMAIGRIPANTVDEAAAVVDKIIEYDNRETPGEWQLNTMLVADDPTDLAQGSSFVGQVAFIRDSERLYNDHIPKVMQTKKVYLTEYPERYITELQTMGRDGAREDIMEAFLNGVSFVNYYGHGDPSVWTQEKVFVSNDLVRLDVNHKYPLILAATCSWGRSDNPDFQSMAEDIVTLDANGAIATIATVRSVYHGTSTSANVKFVEDFTTGLFEGNPDYAYSPLMGDAVLYAKNLSNNVYGTTRVNNNMKFMYFGDPTLIPIFPQNAGVIDSVSRDTLRALDRVALEGRALQRDGEAPSYNDLKGRLTIYDNDYRVSREYVSSTSGSISTIQYNLEGNRLFNGSIDFDGDGFASEAFIPKDIQYHGTYGKIRMMYWNSDHLFDGAAAIDDIHVGGINPEAAADNSGPEIRILHNGSELLNGAVVFDTSRVSIVFEDASGINITGTTGHVLEMDVDNGLQVVDLSELFSYDQNDYSRGEIDLGISNYFDEGEHLIDISAFDNYNNYSNIELTITVMKAGDDLIRNLVNFPNPFKGNTDITFSSGFTGTADLRIYTISGKPVSAQHNIPVISGFNAIPVSAEDDYGHPLAAGVYFYVLEIDTGTDILKQHSKMVVLP